MRRRIAVPTKDDIKVTRLWVDKPRPNIFRQHQPASDVGVDITITFHFVDQDGKPTNDQPVTLEFHSLSAIYYAAHVENPNWSWNWVGNRIEDEGLDLRWGDRQFSSTIGVLEPVICQAILEAIEKQRAQQRAKTRGEQE